MNTLTDILFCLTGTAVMTALITPYVMGWDAVKAEFAAWVAVFDGAKIRAARNAAVEAALERMDAMYAMAINKREEAFE